MAAFFRHNSLATRDLHQTATHGPCMVLVCSLYGLPMLLLSGTGPVRIILARPSQANRDIGRYGNVIEV